MATAVQTAGEPAPALVLRWWSSGRLFNKTTFYQQKPLQWRFSSWCCPLCFRRDRRDTMKGGLMGGKGCPPRRRCCCRHDRIRHNRIAVVRARY